MNDRLDKDARLADDIRLLGRILGDTIRAYEGEPAFTRIEEHETALAERFLGGVPDGMELYGIPGATGRTPTFCFNLPGRSPRDVAERLGERDIYVWDGHYYALEPMRALGLEPDGAVRAGFLHYTSEEEVDRLLEAVADLSARPGA